jgi:hypothetical protein
VGRLTGSGLILMATCEFVIVQSCRNFLNGTASSTELPMAN